MYIISVCILLVYMYQIRSYLSDGVYMIINGVYVYIIGYIYIGVYIVLGCMYIIRVCIIGYVCILYGYTYVY
jgi:hypothetical protein